MFATMRTVHPWRGMVLLGLLYYGIAPWAMAASSSQTVGVQIIMPPRSSATPTPLDEAMQPPPVPAETSAAISGPPVQRTTTIVPEGNSMTVLVTDVPLI